jgi:hypothetical protein
MEELGLRSTSDIDSVQLSLVLQGVAGVDTTPRTISLHPLLTNWGEGTSGTGLGGGGTGQGFPAKQGDATWSQNTLTLLSIAAVCLAGYARRKEYRGKKVSQLGAPGA